ncbi:MAG: AMP-binding protein, partial [Gemmatimonadota bacterium]
MESRAWHKHYEPQVPPSLDYVDLTLPDIFEQSARRHHDRPAIAFWNNRLSYSQLKDQVDRFATGLARLGVTQGERVAISLLNLPQTVISYYAALKLGAQVVVTDPLNTAREISDQWSNAGVRFAIVLDFLFESRIRSMVDQLPV